MRPLKQILTEWLGASAKQTLEREKPLIIAITGSVGKSSTKQLLGAILHASDPVARVRVPVKNYNNELGIPLTVFDLPAPGRSVAAWMNLLWSAGLHRYGLRRTGIKTFVFEMGADHAGDLAYLTSIAKPHVSVVTAVTPEDPSWAPVHAANYPSVDALAKEKSTIVRNVDQDGMIVLNADDTRVIAMRHETSARLFTFGTTEAADVEVEKIQVRTEERTTGLMPVGLEITLRLAQGQTAIFFPGIFGRSAAYALAAATATGLALGLPLSDMMASVERVQSLPGRVRLIPGIKGTMLLDDTYNASPVAALASLRDLASIVIDGSAQRRIVCFGEMRELGEQSTMLHERIGMEVGRLKLDLLAVTGAQAEAYARGAKMAGMRDDQVMIFDDTPELALWVQDILKPGDLVLAKASEGPMRTAEGFLKTKGVRMERVIKELMAEPLRASELLCRQEPLWLSEE